MRLLLLTPMCACAAFVLPALGPRAAAPRAAAPQEVLPEPRVGDVVAFAGDWPGETSVGQIRSLQPRGDRWLADVVPLEDQAGDVWRLPAAALARKRRTAVDVAELVPLEAAPAAEDDAFVLTATEPSAAIKPLSGSAAGLLARAASYRALAPDFKPKGGRARVDYAAEERSREEYAALKRQLLTDSALASAAGLVAVTAATRDLDDARAFALGAAGGLAYVAGLSAFADRAGDDRREGLFDVDLSKYRLAFPAAAFVVLAALDAASGKGGGALRVIPFDEFACAALGVVAYRVPLLARQVFGGGGAEDIAAMLPGSLGKGARELVKQRDAAAEDGDGEAEALAAAARRARQTVLVVCGPPGAGKSTLVDRLVAADPRFAAPRWLSTDRDSADDVVDEAAFDGRDDLAVVFGGDEALAEEETTLLDRAVPKKRGLARAELVDRADGKTCVLDCDVETARRLEGLAGVRLVGVWVSLDSLGALRERLTKVEAGRALARSDDVDAAQVAAVVSERLSTVVDDIDFGVRSPMFEFTIITSDAEALSFAKLQKAAAYVFDG
uniref:Guanylate kinase-like domain-containing protein n=1 Tax=Pelagomonas calceolata TaxID=35677 RepID=A0A7S3ZWU8_9STRA